MRKEIIKSSYEVFLSVVKDFGEFVDPLEAIPEDDFVLAIHKSFSLDEEGAVGHEEETHGVEGGLLNA